MPEKKTILITISRAIIARNLLINQFADILNKKYRVILVTPFLDNQDFVSKFGSLEMAPLFPIMYSGIRGSISNIFLAIHKALIYNPTVEIRSKYGDICRSKAVRFKFVRHLIQKYIFGTLLCNNFFRLLFKKIDALCLPCNLYDAFLEKYRPDLVFITSIGSDDEAALLRNCKNNGIKSVAMAKSWDNCSKIGFREIADRFVVWSEYMREEAIKFQCYTSEQIEIVGIPQFDSYCNLPIPDKAIFFKKYGLDLNKKLIFFGSEGPISDDPEKNKDYVVSFIKEKIIDGTLKDYQILVRPHFSYINDFDRFNILADGELVFVDKDYVRSNSKDGIELSLNNIINLMGAVKYSDAIVVGASTLILDVIANSKMPIIYGFDRTEDTPKYDSVKRFFEYLWMKNLLAVGLDNVAKSREQLIDKIKNFSRLNELKQKEKELVESRFCYRLDGLSGKRLFGFIDKLLN